MERYDDTGEQGWLAQLDEVAGALEALNKVLDSEQDLDVILQRVCQHVIRAIPGADMAGVTLFRHGTPETAASTEDRVLEIDQAQYKAGEGPCLQAAATGTLVRINAEDARIRWPIFTDGPGVAKVGSSLPHPWSSTPRSPGR